MLRKAWTHPKLTPRKPEAGKPVGFELLRVRDVSSNGTGIQDSWAVGVLFVLEGTI